MTDTLLLIRAIMALIMLACLFSLAVTFTIWANLRMCRSIRHMLQDSNRVRKGEHDPDEQ